MIGYRGRLSILKAPILNIADRFLSRCFHEAALQWGGFPFNPLFSVSRYFQSPILRVLKDVYCNDFKDVIAAVAVAASVAASVAVVLSVEQNLDVF
jgi:hypothetical protein